MTSSPVYSKVPQQCAHFDGEIQCPQWGHDLIDGVYHCRVHFQPERTPIPEPNPAPFPGYASFKDMARAVYRRDFGTCTACRRRKAERVRAIGGGFHPAPFKEEDFESVCMRCYNTKRPRNSFDFNEL